MRAEMCAAGLWAMWENLLISRSVYQLHSTVENLCILDETEGQLKQIFY
jgi:hypothetical protein